MGNRAREGARMKTLHLLLVLALASCGGRTELGTIQDIVTLDSGGIETDGSCTDRVLATDKTGASAFAVDDEGRVYWGTADGRVLRLEQGNSTEIANVTTPVLFILLDATQIYFSAYPETLYFGTKEGVIAPLTFGFVGPSLLAQDSNALYVVDEGTGGNGRILAVDKSSHAIKTLLQVTSSSATQVPSVGGLALDSSLAYVNALNGLISIPKVGGPPRTLVSGLHTTSNVVLSPTKAYFLDDDTWVWDTKLLAYDFASKSTSTIAHWAQTEGQDLTIDERFAYVTTHGMGAHNTADAIHRIALDGSKDEIWVTSDSPNVTYGFIRNDAQAVYWTAGTVTEDGSIHMKCK